MSPPTRASGALTGDVGDELIPQRGPPGPPRELYLTHLHPDAGHRGFHERLRRQICVPTRATGALTGDLGDKFVPQGGPPGPPRQTYLTHLCSGAGHQGLHRRLRAHTSIVTPARWGPHGILRGQSSTPTWATEPLAGDQRGHPGRLF